MVVLCKTCHTTATFNVNSTELVIVTLHPSYVYELQVAAVTVGNGPLSETATFTMPEDGKSQTALVTTTII